MTRAFKILLLFFLISLSSCSQKEEQVVAVAINPWPGYEILYLAEKLGYFKDVGANVKLVQLSSLADAQRAYISGRTEGFGSTLIESVQSQFLGGKPGKVVMVPDYSNGGDVILTNKSLTSVADLRDKRVGAELASLGLYLLHRALTQQGLSVEDVTLINTEQLRGKDALDSGKIDAFVSYPPASIDVLADDNYHVIFSSSEIPGDIIDVVTLSDEVIQRHPTLPGKLMEAWQRALDYANANPDQAFAIMAEREGVSSEDFAIVFREELKILSADEQITLFKKPEILQQKADDVCQLMKELNSITGDCADIADLIYQFH